MSGTSIVQDILLFVFNFFTVQIINFDDDKIQSWIQFQPSAPFPLPSCIIYGNAVDGDLLTLTSAESFEACKPYIIYAENGFSGTLEGTVSLSDASNVTDVFTDGYLTGVLTNTTLRVPCIYIPRVGERTGRPLKSYKLKIEN